MKNQITDAVPASTAADTTCGLPEDMRSQLQQAFAQAAPANPNFRAEVWAKINAGVQAPATWAQWLRGHVMGVSLIAAACVVLAGTGGSWLAFEQSRSQSRQQLERYVASIDAHLRLAAMPDSANGHSK